MIIKVFSFFFCLTLLVQGIRFNFDRVEYRFNPEVTNVSATVNEKKVLNVDWFQILEVNRLQVYFSFLTGSNFTNVISNRSFDVCKAFSGQSVTRFLFVIVDLVQKSSNLPNRCPIPVGHYYIHDVNFGKLNFSLGLPIGPVKGAIKCNVVFASKVKGDRSVFIVAYDFYLKVVKK